MKLADLEKVGKLNSERNYLGSLVVMAAAQSFGMKIGHYDVRPDLKDKFTSPILLILKAEIDRVDRDLAALGVTAEEGDTL